jgi:hypothetical protein
MPPDYSRFLPWIFALLIPLAIYRRLRRNFGMQRLNPTRMTVRIVILVVLGGMLAALAPRSAAYVLAEMVGAAAGVALALWGASRTRFLTRNGLTYYVPHTYTGIAVSLLLIGRIAYRLVQVSAGTVPGGTDPSAAGAGSLARSPITLGTFFVLIGYYVCYYGLVLWKSKHLTPADLETSPSPSDSKAPAVARGDTTS